MDHDVARLSAYIDGDLDAVESAAVADHLESCAECRRAVEQLRALTAPAGSRPGSAEPSPRVWEGIERQLQRDDRRTLGWRTFWIGVSLGATAVCIAMAVRFNGWPLRSGPNGGTSLAQAAETVASPGRPADPILAEAESELDGAARHYERSIEKLGALLERETGRWGSDARRLFRQRLAGLDEAIARSRAATRQTLDDRQGHELLFAAYHQKIQFLTDTVHRGAPALGVDLP